MDKTRQARVAPPAPCFAPLVVARPSPITASIVGSSRCMLPWTPLRLRPPRRVVPLHRRVRLEVRAAADDDRHANANVSDGVGPRGPRGTVTRAEPASNTKAEFAGRRLGLTEDTTESADSSRWDLELASPSKINLFLRVLSKREDGYHELASLFQAISLHDVMFFAKLPEDADADVLECSAPGVPSDSSNLVIKALDTFRRHTGKNVFFRVRLDKRIPTQAGLGGGSGNAATALWAANQLCGKPASVDDLAKFGAEFGSDVSFFFSMGAAYCTGRGEILRYIDPLLPETLWLIKPKQGLSTAAVFAALTLDETSDADPLELLAQMQDGYLFSANFVNDLEKPSFALQPRLADIKSALENSGFNRVLMSGSGTCFFCIGEPDYDYFGDSFAERFSFDHDVEIMRAMFLRRKHPDYWYLQTPTDEEMRVYLETVGNIYEQC